MNLEIIYTNSFVNSATDRIIHVMERTLRKKTFFRLSLCGGSTPFPVYAELARKGSQLPWDRVIITFGDERCVSPDHEQSNFRSAKLKFLDLVPIPKSNVLRIKGEETPDVAANEYETELDTIAKKYDISPFNHDLVLLGIGDDGHTASLFPDTNALSVRDRRVVANFVPKLNAHRITFTFPFINQAETVMFMVNDPKKRQVIEDILANKGDYPAMKIKPESGDLIWLIGGLL